MNYMYLFCWLVLFVYIYLYYLAGVDMHLCGTFIGPHTMVYGLLTYLLIAYRNREA